MILHHSELARNLCLIKLTGRLDNMGAADIDQELAAYCAVDNSSVLIDLSDVEFLTSFGMRLLAVNAKTLADRGGRMYLVGPTPNVKDTLDVSGVGPIIPIYDSVSSARSALLAS